MVSGDQAHKAQMCGHKVNFYYSEFQVLPMISTLGQEPFFPNRALMKFTIDLLIVNAPYLVTTRGLGV